LVYIFSWSYLSFSLKNISFCEITLTKDYCIKGDWLNIGLSKVCDPWKKSFSLLYFFKVWFKLQTNSPPSWFVSFIISFNWYQSYILKVSQDHSFFKMGSKQITFKEGASLNRPPLFEREYFSFWQKRMEIFI